jgi:hypothetical protein
MIRALRSLPFVLVIAACSGGSGVSSGKTLASLQTDEYATVCKYFNDHAQLQVGQMCLQTQQKVLRVLYIDCSNNPFKDAMCPATVGDMESCASRDACSVLSPQGTAECKRVAQCAGGI